MTLYEGHLVKIFQTGTGGNQGLGGALCTNTRLLGGGLTSIDEGGYIQGVECSGEQCQIETNFKKTNLEKPKREKRR